MTIGAGAFKNSGIERITIGKRVGAVGKDAFLGCGKLTFVGIKDLAAWCKIKFANEYSNPLHCAHKLNLNGLNIKELVIPEYELPRIEDSRHFGGIIGNVEIPDSVEEIGDYAFFGWDSVKHVSIPKNVKKIGRAAFGKCKGIESINVSSKNEHFYVKNNCLIQKQTQELVFACARSEIPWEEVPAQIGAYTFGDWESLTNVTIPDSVESIGYGAFDGCTNLTRVTMPKRLKKQIKDAFIKERKHIKFTFTD